MLKIVLKMTCCAWTGLFMNAMVPVHATLESDTQLFKAVKEKNLGTAVYLTTRVGANVNARDESGMTPLHYAVHGDTAITKWLLEAGANPDAQDHNGCTPMQYNTLDAVLLSAQRGGNDGTKTTNITSEQVNGYMVITPMINELVQGLKPSLNQVDPGIVVPIKKKNDSTCRQGIYPGYTSRWSPHPHATNRTINNIEYLQSAIIACDVCGKLFRQRGLSAHKCVAHPTRAQDCSGHIPVQYATTEVATSLAQKDEEICIDAADGLTQNMGPSVNQLDLGTTDNVLCCSFKCDLCLTEVSTQKGLSVHKYSAHSQVRRQYEREYEKRQNDGLVYHHVNFETKYATCKLCGTIFTKKGLSEHVRKIHPEKCQYRCKCGEGYILESSFKKHTNRCHPK